MAILEQFQRLQTALAATRAKIAQAAMAKASVRPHAKLRIPAGALTHSSEEAATAMTHLLTRKLYAMRTKTATAINSAVNKSWSFTWSDGFDGFGTLAKMDVANLDEFKQATKGKTRYSTNHVFNPPMQLRPRGQRPYGHRREVYDTELNLSKLTATQYWLKPSVVIDYAEHGENPHSGQSKDRTVHVVHKGGDWLLSDGHHRFAARRLNGEKKIAATVFPRWAAAKEVESAQKRYVKFNDVWRVGTVAKADDYSDIVDEIMKSLQDDFASLPSEVEAYLQQAALSGLAQGVIGIEVSDTSMLADVNTSAKDWAADRAAEMVGMKYDDDGALVENPNAEWSITDSTRTKIADVVEAAFDEPSTMADIAASIDQAGIFDSARAEMIARTEVSRAQMMGNFELWQQSGVVSQYDWLAGDDACPECLDLADGSPYDIDGGPMPIDDSHPNCNCVLAAVVDQEEEQ